MKTALDILTAKGTMTSAQRAEVEKTLSEAAPKTRPTPPPKSTSRSSPRPRPR